MSCISLFSAGWITWFTSHSGQSCKTDPQVAMRVWWSFHPPRFEGQFARLLWHYYSGICGLWRLPILAWICSTMSINFYSLHPVKVLPLPNLLPSMRNIWLLTVTEALSPFIRIVDTGCNDHSPRHRYYPQESDLGSAHRLAPQSPVPNNSEK